MYFNSGIGYLLDQTTVHYMKQDNCCLKFGQDSSLRQATKGQTAISHTEIDNF